MKISAYEEVGRLVDLMANDVRKSKNLPLVSDKYKKRFRSLCASVERDAKNELRREIKEVLAEGEV